MKLDNEESLRLCLLSGFEITVSSVKTGKKFICVKEHKKIEVSTDKDRVVCFLPDDGGFPDIGAVINGWQETVGSSDCIVSLNKRGG